MPQDPYTTRKDFVLPGRPSPAEPEAGQDGPDETPALGAPYPDQPPPAVEFGKTALDQPAPDLRQTALDQTRPVPLPPAPGVQPAQPAPGVQPGQSAGNVQQDRQVAPLPQASQPPQPQQPQFPQASQTPQPPQPQTPQPQAPQASQPQPQAPHAPQPPQGYAPQGYAPQPGYPQQGFAPQGQFPQPPHFAATPAAPGTPAVPGAGAAPGGAWHRQHYAIGVFLVLYGLTNLVTGVLGFSDRKMEVADYLGDGFAGPVLIAVKCLEALLLVVTVAGLVRRREVWFLPALLGWVLGFGVLSVLDLVNGEFVTLAEHVIYALGFALLLFLSYGLSAKVRAARLQSGPQAAPAPVGAPQTAPAPGGPTPPGLSRTQEIALNALNRWQRQ